MEDEEMMFQPPDETPKIRKVRIAAKTTYAKNRIREHGDIMEFIRTHRDDDGHGDRFLVKSLNKTSKGDYWMGWFNNKDARWEDV